MAEKLFKVLGVSGVMIGKNFVTITKGPEGDWESLNKGVNDVLKDHLTQNLPIVENGFDFSQPTGQGNGDVENHLEQVAHPVRHGRSRGVRLGHHVAALGSLAVCRHIDLVGAAMALLVRHAADHADGFRAGRLGIEAEREAVAGVGWPHGGIQCSIGGVSALGLRVIAVGADATHFRLSFGQRLVELAF